MSHDDSLQQDRCRSRRRYTFGLRALLALMLVIASLLAWLGRDVVRARAERAIVAEIQADGGSVYEWHVDLLQVCIQK